jgi:hypothetical protein
VRLKTKILAIFLVAGLVGPACGYIAALLLKSAGAANPASSSEQRMPEVMAARISRKLADGTSCTIGQFNNATGRISEMGATCAVSKTNNISLAPSIEPSHRLKTIHDSFFEGDEAESNTSIR